MCSLDVYGMHAYIHSTEKDDGQVVYLQSTKTSNIKNPHSAVISHLGNTF